MKLRAPMVPPVSSRLVALIGFMGTGKTTAGRVLAKRLGWSFYDLDEVIERRQGKSVAAIFADHGESDFRTMETIALRELLVQENARGLRGMIVAVGGGAFVTQENRGALDHAGAVTVWLQAPVEELRRRCAGEQKVRPLAAKEDLFARLFSERQEAYCQAHFRVDTMHKTVEQVAVELEHILNAVIQAEVVK